MNKRVWTKPTGKVQQFQANEYVGACYSVKCEGENGDVISPDDGSKGRDTSNDKYLLIYHATATHVLDSSNYSFDGNVPQPNGYLYKESRRGERYDTYTPVYYWDGGEILGVQIWHYVTIDKLNSVFDPAHPNRS